MDGKTVNRTVFVLDCNPYCKEWSSQCDEYSVNLPQRSIWSCFIEGVHEYSRIFYDLFSPEESMLTIHISNGTSNDIINNWNEIEQMPEQISKGLLSINVEKIESKADRIKNSIIQAIEKLQSENEEYKINKINGRIVLLLLDNSYKFVDKTNKDNKKICTFKYYEKENEILDIREIITSAWKDTKNTRDLNFAKFEECIFDIIKISDTDYSYVNSYTQDTYYYHVNDDIILSVYHVPILKTLNAVRNLIQLQKNLYTLTITDIQVKRNTESKINYSINMLYTGNGHLTTIKREKKRLFENNFFKNRTTVIKWRSGKPILKNINSTTCIHKITPMDISNDITNIFIDAILTNETYFYFTPYEEEKVPWDNEQPIISHMIYFNNGHLLLSCLEKIRPNTLNLPTLLKVKEVCKLKCEDFENIIDSSTIRINVPINTDKEIETLFYKNKENDFISFKPYENVSKNRLRELSFIKNPKDFKIDVPKIINKLTIPLASIDEKSPIYIGEPAKLLKPFIDNYINEDLNENIMVTIRSALKILTIYYNENNKSLFPSISNKNKRKILYEILIRDLRQIGEKYKNNSELHKTIYSYIEKHFGQDDNGSVSSRPSTPSKLDQNSNTQQLQQELWDNFSKYDSNTLREKEELINNSNNSSSKKSTNRLSTNSRTSSPYLQNSKNSRNSKSQQSQQQIQPSQSRLRTNSSNSKLTNTKEATKPISYLVVNKPSDEEIQNDIERKDNGEKGSLFNLYWNNKENRRTVFMTYLNIIGGYGWKLEDRNDFIGRNGLNLEENQSEENSTQENISIDNAKSSSSIKSNTNNYGNYDNNSSSMITNNTNSNTRSNHNHSHSYNYNSNNQKDGNSTSSSVKHTNKKIKLNNSNEN
ncbi:cell cycle and development regulator-domain-containing protein [Neocallimastix sp. 'constans']|jgi:hypothetical protein